MRRLTLLFFLLSCTSPAITFENGASFHIERAITSEQHAQGLMERQTLAPDEGMLFVFEDEHPRMFWMKNMLIPLDMIFFDTNKTVVEVKTNVQPCTHDPCATYPSRPAMYVLEVNAGTASAHELVIGMNATLT